MCERNLGKYNYPKLVKIMAKAEKKINGTKIELVQHVNGGTGLINLIGLSR